MKIYYFAVAGDTLDRMDSFVQACAGKRITYKELTHEEAGSARYCRDFPIYAAWMIETKAFWRSLTQEQRWQVCVAAPGHAIEYRWAWESLTPEQQQHIKDLAK